MGLPVQFLSAQLLLFCWQLLLFFPSVFCAEQATREFRQLPGCCCSLIQVQNDGGWTVTPYFTFLILIRCYTRSDVSFCSSVSNFCLCCYATQLPAAQHMGARCASENRGVLVRNGWWDSVQLLPASLHLAERGPHLCIHTTSAGGNGRNRSTWLQRTGIQSWRR